MARPAARPHLTRGGFGKASRRGGTIVRDAAFPADSTLPKPVESPVRPSNFLEEILAADAERGTYGGRVLTRFPPEPNGYPHVGHAMSICLNFGLAEKFGGQTNVRYDDTNPETERQEYADALLDAVTWLGFDPKAVLFTSDYFEPLYAWAVQLVQDGKAYVDSQDGEAIRQQRGTVTEPGTNSPYRDRPADESLRLLDEMRRGLHPDGAHVLRAKIDMAHPNMKMRDPLMYRIRRGVPHYRRGLDWSIYPLYDWAHGQSDAIEGVTHSLCTLEFDVNRELYDWYLDALGIAAPRNRQYEFARLNLDYTVTSKRKLLLLVNEGHVSGWDDPRMPTVAGMRRRGIRPEALRRFVERVGVSKVNGRVDLALFEHIVRDDLNALAPRVLAVARPVRLTLTNWPAGKTETREAPYWPHDVTPPEGAPLARPLSFSGQLWIDRDDVSLDPPKGWKRLAVGADIRLRHAYVIHVDEVVTDAAGEVVEVKATYYPDSAGGGADEARKARGVVQWVDAATAVPATFRLYDRLFAVPAPEDAGREAASDDEAKAAFLATLTPHSLVETQGFVEASVAAGPTDARYQFERTGFFWQDPLDTRPDALVFNRIVTLKDGWAPVDASAQAGTSASPAPEASKRASATPSAVPARKPEPVSAADVLDGKARERFDALVAAGAGREDAAVMAQDPALVELFAAADIAGGDAKALGTLVAQDARRLRAAHPGLRFDPREVGRVAALVAERRLSPTGAREVLEALAGGEHGVDALVAARGLAVVSDDAALRPHVDAVLAAHPEEAARFRAGEAKLIGFLTGQAMRRAGKGADARRVGELLREALNG